MWDKIKRNLYRRWGLWWSLVIGVLLVSGCTAFGGRRSILAKISVPSLFTFELSTTVNGTYKDTQTAAQGESDLVAAPLPVTYDSPAVGTAPQKPAEPSRPAAPTVKLEQKQEANAAAPPSR